MFTSRRLQNPIADGGLHEREIMTRKSQKEGVIEQLLQKFFAHQITIKMYHFQTPSYGAHVATDAYLTKFALNFDQFMEIAQGKWGRVQIDRIQIDVDMITSETVNDSLNTTAQLLQSLNGIIPKEYDLLAIRDVMMTDLNQLKYLLTFK